MFKYLTMLNRTYDIYFKTNPESVKAVEVDFLRDII